MVVVHSHRHATRAVVTVILAAFVVLLLAAEAQAYVPGELIWAQCLGTSTSQADARDIAEGPKGAIAIAGSQTLPTEESVPMVAKYTAAGLEWVRTYEGRGGADAVAFDRAGNVYVAATVASAQYHCDIVLIKYNGDGVQQWAATWGGDDADRAFARHIAVDKSGDVIVVGTEDTFDDAVHFIVPAVVVLKYDSDGTLAWPAAAVYEPTAGDATIRTFELSDATLDKAGDVYVSGTLFTARYGSGSDMAGLALKFTGADGALVASRTDEYPPGTESRFAGIAVRGSRVAVAGTTLDMTDNGAVIETHGLVAGFDLSLQEERRHEWDADDARHEAFSDVELDARGDVYVTGSQASFAATGPSSQAVTLKLDPGLSTVLWSATYAPGAADASTSLMALDANGDVYVAGVQRTGTPADYWTSDSQDFLTIKYGRSGELEWLGTWPGGGPSYGRPCGLVLGAKRDVFVGGQAWSADGVPQAALLRYQR